MSNPIGIYLHIPFCISKCPYCDFYSLPYCEQNAQQYVGALLHAAGHRSRKGTRGGQLYFGGGTPVLLGGALLEILQGVYRNFSVQPDCEVTLEANPAAMTLQTLRQLHGGGFNRISMGVQSASDRELQTLGRRHSFEQAVQSVQMAQQAGFENVSVDLMLGSTGTGTAVGGAFCQHLCTAGRAAHLRLSAKDRAGNGICQKSNRAALSRRGPERTTVFGYGRTDGAAWIFASMRFPILPFPGGKAATT